MTPYAQLIWFQVIFGRLDLRHRKQAEAHGGRGCGPSIMGQIDCGLNGTPCSLQSFSQELIH